MNKSRIGSENRRFHWNPTCVGMTPMKRSLNHVLEVELNLVGFRCVRESIERFLRSGFDTLDNTDNSVNIRFIDHAFRSINEKPNVFAKL